MAHALISSSFARGIVLAAAMAACGCGNRPDSPPQENSPAAPVTRVVSLVPTLTETVVALGAGDLLVGIGEYDPAVPGRADVPRLGDAFSVSLEALTALEPDVVLVNGVRIAARLEPIQPGIRVEVLPTDRLEDVFATIERLGEITERPLAARTLSDRLHSALTSARTRAAERSGPSPSVLVVVQRRPLYTAGAGSYLHELLAAVGARNAAGDIAEAWPVISEESVVARAPDIVLDASSGTSDPDAPPEPLTGLPNARVLVLGPESESLFRAGPRLPEALELLERLIFEAGDAGKPGNSGKSGDTEDGR
jgi:iron complex transport system substrate-binding protein